MKRTFIAILIISAAIALLIVSARTTVHGKAGVQQEQTSTDQQRKKLSELNASIQELDKRLGEIRGQKKALEDERSRLLQAIARDEAELEFRNSRGYVVVRVDDAISVTLLMHGREKRFRLFNLAVLPANDASVVAFLKKELVAGTAYVRCQDSDCGWGYLYAQKEGPSLNARLVQAGLAFAQNKEWTDAPLNPAAPHRVLDPMGNRMLKVYIVHGKDHYHRAGCSSLEVRRVEVMLATAAPYYQPCPICRPPVLGEGNNSVATDEPASSPTGTPASPAPSTSTGGEVHVKGYYRKDGTYVRPHTRSAPGTKKKN